MLIKLTTLEKRQVLIPISSIKLVMCEKSEHPDTMEKGKSVVFFEQDGKTEAWPFKESLEKVQLLVAEATKK